MSMETYYIPRYAIEVDTGDGNGYQVAHLTDSKPDASEREEVLSLAGLDSRMVDLAMVHKPRTFEGRADRSYYGLPFKGGLDQFEAHMAGVIDRLYDDALDHLNARFGL